MMAKVIPVSQSWPTDVEGWLIVIAIAAFGVFVFEAMHK